MDISRNTAHQILQDNVGKRTVAAKWPKESECNFLSNMSIISIVAKNKTWVYSFESELKQQSAE